jgi:hypothetical protein
MVAAQLYETVMRDATEDIYLVPSRQAADTRLIVVEFDAGREPGFHAEHTLNISVRDSDLSVSAFGIPHEWLPASTGFIDTRFFRLVAGLLAELVKQAQEAGRFI